jgi:hypothetical protein
VEALPPERRERSFSDKQIVLEYEGALLNIDLLVGTQLAILRWEAWVKYTDVRHGHRGPVIGAHWPPRRQDETWEEFVKDAAAYYRRTIEQEHYESSEKPTYTGKSSYFWISAIDREWYDSPRI